MLVLTAAAIVLIVDQLSKARLAKVLLKDESLPVIKDIFHITLVHNTGGAFGIFQNATALFIVTSVVAIFFIAIFYIRAKKRGLVHNIAIPMILGGALSNLLDRVRFGFVVDYLDFRVWPVFNIADACISIGVIILLLGSLRRK